MRFGAGRAATSYGLGVEKSLTWHRCEQPGQFRAEIELPALHADELLLPSLILPAVENYAFVFSLTAAGQHWWLADVSCTKAGSTAQRTLSLPISEYKSESGTGPASAQQHPDAKTLSTHLDYFAAHASVDHPVLSVYLSCDSRPSDYLLVVSRRQKNLRPQPPSRLRTHQAVPPISQMVQPSAQRHRTCSPTAVSMLLAHYGSAYQPSFIDACRDPRTNLYGIWPLNIVQAGQRGFTGAAELVSSWQALEDYEYPFIASISFAKGELARAPLEETAGHLVVVCGTTATSVLCNDPAAPGADSVAREYDLQQFTNAWLATRGAAYLIRPSDSGSRPR